MERTRDLPARIVDMGGDTWHLCSDGLYEVNGLATSRRAGSATYTYIEKNLGIRKIVSR